MSDGFYEEVRGSETFMSGQGLSGFCVHIQFFGGSSLGTFHKVFKEQIQSSTCCFSFGSTVRFCFGTDMRFPFFITMQWLSLKCSTRGFPSYRALIWFCTGLGGAIFLKGNMMSDPPPDMFSTCGACLMDFMRGFGALKRLCQLTAF